MLDEARNRANQYSDREDKYSQILRVTGNLSLNDWTLAIDRLVQDRNTARHEAQSLKADLRATETFIKALQPALEALISNALIPPPDDMPHLGHAVASAVLRLCDKVYPSIPETEVPSCNVKTVI